MTGPNRDQAEHWNSAEETGRWVTHQELYDRMLAPFADMVLGAAALAAGEQVLDVGCGCGATTLAAARVIAPGQAFGVDLSAPMLDRAISTAKLAGLGNASFERADAQVHAFGQVFDAVISRFGVMFFDDPIAAFANVRSATRPGGRLTFACWQDLTANEWLAIPVAAMAAHVPLTAPVEPGTPDMFSFGQPERIRQVLGAAGWGEVTVTARRTPILVGGGQLDDAVAFVRNGSIGRRMLDGADAATQALAIAAVRDLLAGLAGGEQGNVSLEAAVWLVQARASGVG
jgi:SAM-dependent methyltransferase